jgi:hypothetical protein
MKNTRRPGRAGTGAIATRIREGLRRGNDVRLRKPGVAVREEAPAPERPEKVLIESERPPS